MLLNKRDNMEIRFTPCYPLLDIANLSISGDFLPMWDKKYETRYSRNGKPSGVHPTLNGSRLKVSKIRSLIEGKKEIKQLAEENEIVYLLFSDVYKIFYVGITSKGIQKGIFGSNGRLIHHIRKLIASNNSSTSHTKGWQAHAIDRYEDFVESPSRPTDSDLLSDVWIAFGAGSIGWQSKDYEGTVVSYFEARLSDLREMPVLKLNTGSTLSQDAQIKEPKNLKLALINSHYDKIK